MKEINRVVQPFMLERVINNLHEIKGVPADNRVESVVRAIQTSDHTGPAGDGRIFVILIKQTVKIRTGERDTHESCNRQCDEAMKGNRSACMLGLAAVLAAARGSGIQGNAGGQWWLLPRPAGDADHERHGRPALDGGLY